MRERFSHCWRIGVSRQALTLVSVSRWRRSAPRLLAETALAPHDCAGPEALAACLRTLLAGQANARRSAQVVLADDWLRLWAVAPPPGASRRADLEAACALRFQSLFGEPAAPWRIDADWDARAPFLAAAAPRWLAPALEQEARAAGLALSAIAPQSIAAWNRWCAAIAPGSWFGQVHDGLLTLGAIQGQRLCALRAVALPPAPAADLDWLQTHVAREALRLGLDAPARLQVCGAAPSGWSAAALPGFRCDRLDPMPAAPLSPGMALALTGWRA